MSKPIRFVFASDSHGDMNDPEALDALWEFCKDYKPEVRVAGGDHFDFRSLRRGVGTSDAESGESSRPTSPRARTSCAASDLPSTFGVTTSTA